MKRVVNESLLRATGFHLTYGIEVLPATRHNIPRLNPSQKPVLDLPTIWDGRLSWPELFIAMQVRSPEHSQGSAIEVLGSPDHGCGTVCPLNCDSTFASPSLGGYLTHFCSLRLGALW